MMIAYTQSSPTGAARESDYTMLHRMTIANRFSLGVAMLSSICRAEEETLGIIELVSNLADVEKPPELPAGNYTGEIQDVQTGTSQKGNQYFNIKFVIPPKEIPADLQDDFEDGAVMYYNRIIVPKGKDRRALFNLRKFIEAIGLDANTTSVDPNEWMGQTARLKVVMGSYQGEARSEIKSVESAEAPASRGNKPVADKNADVKPAAARRGRK